MKILKSILIIISIFLLSGCEQSVDKKYSDVTISDDFYIYTDVDTCVQYFVSNGHYNKGNVSPKFNQDGTLRLNKECVRNNAND